MIIKISIPPSCLHVGMSFGPTVDLKPLNIYDDFIYIRFETFPIATSKLNTIISKKDKMTHNNDITLHLYRKAFA